MNNYEKYSQSISRIFKILEKMKTDMPDSNNISYIDSIYEYKDDLLKTAEELKNNNNVEVEALGND